MSFAASFSGRRTTGPPRRRALPSEHQSGRVASARIQLTRGVIIPTLGKRSFRPFCRRKTHTGDTLTWIIHGHTPARSASEGLATGYPRLRVGLVCRTLRRKSTQSRIIWANTTLGGPEVHGFSNSSPSGSDARGSLSNGQPGRPDPELACRPQRDGVAPPTSGGGHINFPQWEED